MPIYTVLVCEETGDVKELEGEPRIYEFLEIPEVGKPIRRFYEPHDIWSPDPIPFSIVEKFAVYSWKERQKNKCKNP